MRIRTLMTATALVGGLFAAAATPASAATPAEAMDGCTLTVTDFYYSIGMQTAFAKLHGGCTGTIDMVMEQSDSPTGPFHQVDTLYHVQQSADGTAALGYFMDPDERGWCRAKATGNGLTAYSANAVRC